MDRIAHRIPGWTNARDALRNCLFATSTSKGRRNRPPALNHCAWSRRLHRSPVGRPLAAAFESRDGTCKAPRDGKGIRSLERLVGTLLRGKSRQLGVSLLVCR